MIVPYGHGGKRVGGLPWVTITIFALCLIAFLLTSGASQRSGVEAGELFSEIAETYLAQPSLELETQLEDLIYQRLGVDENQREVFRQSLTEQIGAERGRGPRSSQGEFDALVDRFWTAYRGSPNYRYGVVPSRISLLDLLTYQFLHGGWGHLLGNLLFLYLAAPHMEGRWGGPFFLTFYLMAGIVAALFWAVRYPELDVPLVGASGSIAGVMGAFLICFGTTKIRFFYWFFIVWGTFEAPAWLMLPLWLVMEVISGRTMDVLSQGTGGGGVAHWAHVWGFIFGMAFAFVMGVFGVDQRLAARSDSVPTEPGEGIRPDPGPTPRLGSPTMVRTRETGYAEPAVSSVAPPPGTTTLDSNEPSLDVVEMVDSPGASVELRPQERLRLVEAIPRSLDGAFLAFEVAQRGRTLDLTNVEAVAVGAVTREGQRPYLIIDLLLDPPSDSSVDLRVLRIRSTTFDPRGLVGGDDPMAAFVDLLESLLSASGGEALPDEATIREPSTRSYSSIEEYQQRVLGVMG